MNMSEDNSGTTQGTSDVGPGVEDVESGQVVVSFSGEEVVNLGVDKTITGSAAADTIVFTSANTTVEAGDGANTITGTSGNNLISAGIGADTITVTTGHNSIDAGSGINTITAMSGNNQITAGDGADTITLTSGNNKINAGGGINTIAATTGNNSITTGDGADTITVSTGNNTIHARGGANTITASSGVNTITAGDGADTITTGGLTGGGNTIDAGNGANTVTTGAGNDTVTSGNGADTITTGAGDDTITIKGGIDTIAAGAGNDTLIADLTLATGAVSLSALAGTAAAGYAGNISGLGIATFAGVENFKITSGDFNDTITTGDGTDVVHAGGGNDIVNLGGGDDEAIYTMAANAGASDVYQGGAGDDTLTLELTEEQWDSDKAKADIADYLAFQAAHTDPITGEADSAVFQFTAFNLSVSEFEALSVRVDGVALDLNSTTALPGTFGFVLNGIDYRDWSGRSVSSAGDVNGDGIDDILIGAQWADQDGVNNVGKTYAVFGKDTAFDAAINLASLTGSDGFVLNGFDEDDSSGYSVSSAGDVNGDGIDDILIGSPSSDPGDTDRAGETYVVFGKDTAFDAAIVLANLNGSDGFVLNGIDSLDYSGHSVSSAGDVNGDSIDDILIGARFSDPDGTDRAGETYVVFGKDTVVSGDFDAAIDLAYLNGSDGFVLNGIDSLDYSGNSVSSELLEVPCR